MPSTQLRGANNGTGTSQISPATISNADIHASAAIATTKLADSLNFILRGGSVPFTADQSLGGFKITNLGAPISANDAARKADVDAASNGLDLKASVRAATTTNGTLASAFQNAAVIDGVTLATNDRILIKNQSTGADNGIYTVNTSGAPTRATDADVSAEVTAGMFTFVEEGTLNADSGFVLTNNGVVILGTTALVFTQFSGAGAINAGAGLTQTGTTIDVIGTANRIVVASDSIDIGTDVVTLIGSQILTNKSITGGQITSAVATATDTVSKTGTGSIYATSVSPAFTTPTLGVASATSLATSAASPLLLTNGQLVTVALTSQTVGAATVTIPNLANVSDTFVFTTLAQTLSNKIFVAPALGTPASGIMTNVTGTAASLTAGAATNIAGGTGGTIPYQSAASTTVLLANGTAGQVLQSNGTTLAPSWVTAAGGLGISNFVARETPSGTVNGSNTAFTLANTPTSGTEQVYLNGIQQEPGSGNDYTISGTAITYLTAPLTGDKIRVSYMK